MIDHRNRKKKLIISYKNLPDNIRELFKDAYPDGYKDYLQKTIKPNGEPIFVVPLETDDTSYMVKFDVKIDTGLVEEDLDKDLYGGDEEQGEGEFAPLSEAIDKEEGNDHAVGKMRHGALEEVFEGLPEDKKEFEMANEDLEDEYGDRPDEDDDIDSYIDGEKDGDEDIEPDDDELLDIEALLDEADSGEGMLRENNPPEEKRGRKRKSLNPDIEAVKAVGSEAKALKRGSKEKATVKAKKSGSAATTKVKTTKVTKTVKEPKTTAKKVVATKTAKESKATAKATKTTKTKK